MTTSRIQLWYQNPKNHLILAQFSNSPWTGSGFGEIFGSWQTRVHNSHPLLGRTFLNLEAVPTFMQKGLLDLAPGILGVAVA